jgi:multiple sugar transport system substrate-binding protein
MRQRFGKTARKGAVVGMLAAASIVVTGCAGPAAAPEGGGVGTADKPVSVRMIANEAFANQWQTQMVPEFNKKFPNIKVQIDGVPYAELLAKSMLDQTGAKPTYDVIIADDPWIPQLAQTGALLDLKKDAAQWTDEDYDWDDFHKAPLAAGEWDGAQYGVPVRSNLLLMFTNKSLYEQAGLPAPTSDLTWDEFFKQAPKLVRDTDGDGKADVWATDTYFTRDSLTPTIWQTILDSNGGDLLDEDNMPAFNNADGVKALQTQVDMLQFAPPGASTHGFNESLEAFRQGKVATMFTWGSVFKGTAVDPNTTTLTPEQVGIQVMPVGDEMAGAHRGIWSAAVSAKSANAEAAWALVQWLSSKEGEHWQANSLGVFPARKSTLASTPESGSEWLAPVFEALDEGFAAAGDGEMWRPRHPESDAVQQILATETARATSGETTAKEALENAARLIEELLG